MMTDPEEKLRAALGEGVPTDASLKLALDIVLEEFDCPVGTLHAWDDASKTLHLKSENGIPAAIRDKVTTIPLGKGMAGLAAERLEPVQVCNLQADDSGQAKPGAKLTQMEGSIALPMISNGKLTGTLGVAKPVAYEFSPNEISRLMTVGEIIGSRFLRDDKAIQ